MDAPRAEVALGAWLPSVVLLRFVALLFLCVSCLTGCIIGEPVCYQPAPDCPTVPKDPTVLRQHLDKGVDLAIIGLAGSVWHLRMTGPMEGMVFDHVLVLYPDGRCFTSLYEERVGRWYDTTESSFFPGGAGQDEASRSRRAQANARMLSLIQSKCAGPLLDFKQGLYAWGWPTRGRFSAENGKLRVNLMESHAQYSTGIIMYDTTGVSQLVFVKRGDGYVLDQDESRPIWWSPEDNMGRLFRSEDLTLNAVRSRIVTLRRVDDFAPPPLPADWKW